MAECHHLFVYQLQPHKRERPLTSDIAPQALALASLELGRANAPAIAFGAKR